MFSIVPFFATAEVPPLAARKSAFVKWIRTLANDSDTLDLSNREINDKHLAVLSEWGGISKLRRLRLAHNNVKTGTVLAFLRSCSETLEVLDLTGTKIKGDIVAALASIELPRLEVLVLDLTTLKSGFADAQLECPRLTTLSAREARMNATGVKGLVAQPFMPQLERLLVDFNEFQIGPTATIIDAMRGVPLAELRVEFAGQDKKRLARFFDAKARTAMTDLEIPWNFPYTPNLEEFCGLRHLALGRPDVDILNQDALQRIAGLSLSTTEVPPVSLANLTHVEVGLGQHASGDACVGAVKWLESFVAGPVVSLDLVFAPECNLLFEGSAALCGQLRSLRAPIFDPARLPAWIERSPLLRVVALDSLHHRDDAPETASRVLAASADLEHIQNLRLVLDEHTPDKSLRAFHAAKPSAAINLRSVVKGDYAKFDGLIDAVGARLIDDEHTPLALFDA